MGACRLHSAPRAMTEHDQQHGEPMHPMKATWEDEFIHDLGTWNRRVREFLGFSQDKLAKLAGVSQGAISRVEAGRGKATPLLTYTKISTVYPKALGDIDAAMLTDEAKAMLERARSMSQLVPRQLPGLMLVDPVLARLISTYQTLPERERRGFVTVLDATATSLARQPAAMPPPVAVRGN